MGTGWNMVVEQMEALDPNHIPIPFALKRNWEVWPRKVGNPCTRSMIKRAVSHPFPSQTGQRISLCKKGKIGKMDMGPS
jgi:hypothetical protein